MRNPSRWPRRYEDHTPLLTALGMGSPVRSRTSDPPARKKEFFQTQ